MNIRKIIISTVAAAGMLGGVVATTGASASASSTPVVYQASGPAAVRPGEFSIVRSPGGGSGFFMTHLRWSRWNRSSAAGRGRENFSRSLASIILWRVRTHGGTRYYSRLTVRAPRGFTSGHLHWSWSSHEWAWTS